MFPKLLTWIYLVGFSIFLHPVSPFSLITVPWTVYRNCLTTHPILTKACTSSTIMSVSDALCQRLEQSTALGDEIYLKEHEKGKHNFRRTRDVAITGMVWAGPLSHTWYMVLELLVVTSTHNRILGLLLRLLLDATIFSPIAIFGYLTCRSILEGQKRPEIITKLKMKWKGAVFSAWKFRPLANIGEFYCKRS
jgi:hypothetical protein